MSFSKVSVETLIDQFDVFLLDVWGVIHDGVSLYPGVLETFKRLKDLNKQFLFISNAPRPAPVIQQKLLDLGIPVTLDDVLTSGDVVREQLVQFNDPVFSTLGRRFYHLGELRNQDILAGLPVQTVKNIEDADFILLTSFLEEDEDLEQFIPLFEKMRVLNLPIVCANPDGEVPHGDKSRYCAGYFSKQYEKMGGIVHYYGKPAQNIYDAAFRRLQLKSVESKRIVMVGDTLETDILGAVQAKIAGALVETGNTKLLCQKDEIESLEHLFEKLGINPHWVIPSFGLV